MKNAGRLLIVVVPLAAMLASGCTDQKVDFSTIQRPERVAELDAYNVFVGKWNWEAELVNADEPDKIWSGTAEWRWELGNQWLHGVLTAKSARTNFNAAGVWGWNPNSKKYVWWMFNNWGFAQEGTASYCQKCRRWQMNYTSVGLDGTPSFGYYTMKVVDDDTLEWTNLEWADAMHMVKKMEMKGTYKRQK